MAIKPRDLRFYGSATMPEDDTTNPIGGAIDTSVCPCFKQLPSTQNIRIVSSNTGDTTQTVTVTGRDAGGAIIAETKTLNGRTTVAMTANTSWERLLKAVKSATCAGDVAVEANTAVRANTAAAGAVDTITLDAGASGSDNTYNDMIIRITGGTGIGQIAKILSYVGSSKIATIDKDWGTVPDNTSTFTIGEGMYFQKAPSEVLTVRDVFYASFANASGGANKKVYEKIFAKNDHGSLTLTVATIQESADPSGLVAFGIEAAKNGTGNNGAVRTTAPGAITFDSANKSIADLATTDKYGIWLELTLNAGQAAQKTTYTPKIAGQTT